MPITGVVQHNSSTIQFSSTKKWFPPTGVPYNFAILELSKPSDYHLLDSKVTEPKGTVKMTRYSILTATLTFCLVLVTNSACQAQESDTKATPPSTNETRPFTEVFKQWKMLLGRLRDVRKEYDTAEKEEVLTTIAQKHRELVTEANTLLPELRYSAVTAYSNAPNKDRTITRLLFSMVENDVKRDNYEPAVELAQLLVDNQCDEQGLHNLAGIAAFCTNNFDQAEINFNQAQQNGTLKDQGQGFAATLQDYKNFWEYELKTREAEAAADDLPRVKVLTSKGEITIELFENEAPQAVGNFVSLVENGFYDGLIFHRVLPGFMAQGGCPDGTGQGGPGYNIYCECEKKESRKHFRGSLSMAHAGRNTGGSQFFLTFIPTSHLNGQHTVFGRVIAGWHVLAAINRVNPQSYTPQAPPDKIVSATVLRKRDHLYAPTKVE